MKLRLLISTLSILCLCCCAIPSLEDNNTEFVIGVWNGREGQKVEEIANQYSERFHIPLTVEVINADVYHDHLSAIILSKSSKWDIALAKSEWIVPWVVYRGVNPFGNDISYSIEGIKVDGKIYAMTIAHDVPVLWYRKDILSGANIIPPQTWEELYIIAKKLSNSPDFYGMALANSPYSVGQDYLNIYLGFGGKISPEPMKIPFRSDEGVSAMDYFIRLSHEGLMPSASEQGSDPISLLQNNQAAMAILWTSQAQVLFDCEISPALCVNGESLIDGVEIPTIDRTTRNRYLRKSTDLIVPAGCDSTWEAESFLSWIASPDGQALLQMTDDNNTPVNGSVDRYFGNGVDLDDFRFTDTFYDQLNQTIYDAVNGQISSSEAMLILDGFMKDDLNRTDSRP
jgi:ABC-type glycerol-3-phosphate transport system substrate-binding protein